MQKYLFSTIGTFHTQHNEDAALICDLSEDRILIAVMDGCSMGTDSFFVSTLIAKLLRKIAKAEYYKAFITKQTPQIDTVLTTILHDLFAGLKIQHNQLDLANDELLTRLTQMAVHSRSATTDLVANGFNHWHKNERASSRSATNDIKPKYALTLIMYNIGRAAGTYIQIFIYVHRVKTRCYHIGRRAATYQPST